MIYFSKNLLMGELESVSLVSNEVRLKRWKALGYGGCDYMTIMFFISESISEVQTVTQTTKKPKNRKSE